jgi:mono/diheme cytochrome c family protein
MTPRALLLLAAASAALAACQQQDMAEQARLKPEGRAEAFAADQEARPVPAGTVARDGAAEGDETPPPVDLALLERGRQRFDIFCSPCHGYAGYGDGMIVQRGFPSPPSFHSDALRSMTARRIFDTITDGKGVMYSYADRVPPRDRWAIAAYVRALQLSQSGAAGATGGGS